MEDSAPVHSIVTSGLLPSMLSTLLAISRGDSLVIWRVKSAPTSLALANREEDRSKGKQKLLQMQKPEN